MKLFEIPKFSKYRISLEGEVVNIKLNRVLKGSVNNSGYVFYRLTSDEGITYSLGKHRLLCYVFKGLEIFNRDIVVNHINGNKLDNRLSNLECVSYQENTEHAGYLGLTTKCLPVKCFNTKTQELKEFPSIKKCAIYLKVSKDTLSFRIKKHQGVYLDWQIKSILDNTPFLSQEEATKVNSSFLNKPLLVKYFPLGETRVYSSQLELSIDLGCSPSVVTELMKLDIDYIHVYRDFIFQVRLLDDIRSFREIKDVFEVLAEQGNVIVSCFNESQHLVFLTPKRMAQYFNLRTNTIHYRLQSNYSKVFNGFRFGYYRDFKKMSTPKAT